MLAVPPLIPQIHHELHLDEKGVGALVSLPVLLLATAAVPGSLLIARLGVRGALATGLGLVAVFGALRGFRPEHPGPVHHHVPDGRRRGGDPARLPHDREGMVFRDA